MWGIERELQLELEICSCISIELESKFHLEVTAKAGKLAESYRES